MDQYLLNKRIGFETNISYAVEFYMVKLLASFLIAYKRNTYEADEFLWKQHITFLRMYLAYVSSLLNIFVFVILAAHLQKGELYFCTLLSSLSKRNVRLWRLPFLPATI